jgi:hypothetical protein
MDIREKLTTLVTQDTGRRPKQNKHKQTNTRNTNKINGIYKQNSVETFDGHWPFFSILNNMFFLCFSSSCEHIKRKLRGNRRGNKEWTFVRNWQHWLHKTQGEGQNKTNTNKQTNKDKHKEKTNTPFFSILNNMFFLCFSSSCVAYIASFSGLSIFDWPFGIL